ncbi:MAG: hypothetical protein AB8B60_12920 [Sulfitobacter sp.]
MNFAYNPGPKEADLLIIDKIKAADVIGRIAKKEGEGVKVAMGTFEMDAKLITLSVLQTVPGLAKKFRKYLKTLDLSLKVEVLDATGEVIDSDQEEEHTNETVTPVGPLNAVFQSDSNEAEAPTDTDQKTAITERLRALQAPISALGPLGAPLVKAVARVVNDLKSGNLDQAEATLDKIEEGLSKVAAHQEAKKSKPAAQPPDHASLVTRAGALKAALDGLAGNDKSAVVQPLVAAVGLIKSGDRTGADAALTAAETALNALSGQTAEEDVQDAPDVSEAIGPEQKAWEAQRAALQTDVDGALQGGAFNSDTLRRSWEDAKALAEAGEFAETLQAVDITRSHLADAEKAAEIAHAAAEAALISSYRKTRQSWSQTRAALHADLVKLKMVIDAHTKGIDSLAEIAENTGVLLEYLDGLDRTLETILGRLVDTPAGPARTVLKQEAGKVIEAYRAELATEFFEAVDQNGFTQTTIRSTALDALEDVETALAA